MLTPNEKLGFTIKKYRKAKNYSTQELAKHLNVSVGFVNHLEHGKNNVFKLNLLMQLINVLDIPLAEIILDKSIQINGLHINPKEKKLEIYLNNKGFNNIDILTKELNLVINSFLETISEYEYTPEAIKAISTHTVEEMKYIKQLKNLKQDTDL
ncbi:helix-turn-helix transcriptional regulator [Clostridium aestuarii]|uniref:Helix-turn-helix transcriptional regulator n=1 Tax=Clostridium aestuarii TaxID=338193 RepID=A0ABT4CW89_9CLOT|nr:helix-turn-helix transcriptional regulator [Clostridium aestuarii]MCY6483253.1 helix-turn-helix transcriptional regulator [Clostridium aestuarii]